jgi:peptidyl-Lys metalloendopeptidase
MYNHSLRILMRKSLNTILTVAVFIFVPGAETTFIARNPDQSPKVNAGVALTNQGLMKDSNDVPVIKVTLSSDVTSFPSTAEVFVHMTFTNSSEFSVKVLKWYLPIDGMEAPLFTITRDGEPVTYLGILVKRSAPTENDYITLQAGEILTLDVALSPYYDISVSGNYSIIYDVASDDLYNGVVENAGRLTSNLLNLFAEGRTPPKPDEVTIAAVTGANSFTASCNASMQTNLINARNAASNYANDAYTVFNNGWLGPRYTTWFGTYEPARYNTVSSHFTSILNAVDTANPMTFDCSCTDPDTYAYVSPSAPYEIYLCGAFWSAPLIGTDSKAGVMIHEVSHFSIVASTNDYVYGQTGSKNLAISNPSNAIYNADSHEYFAENTPPLDNGAPLVSSIIVTNNADSGPGSLRDAVNNIVPGGTITFSPALAGQTITLASELLVNNKSLTIDGSGLTPRLSISGNNSVRIFNINTEGAEVAVSLKSLVLKNGRRTGTQYMEYGAAIYADLFTNLSVDHVTFSGNQAYQAGALYISPAAIVTITNSEFISNSSQSSAGAIYVKSMGELAIDSSVFSNNSAAWDGGAIVLDSAGTRLVENTTFSNNTAGSGGAINIIQSSNSDVTLSNNLFSGNSSSSSVSSGGALLINLSSIPAILNIENNTFYANQAANLGGAIANSGTAVMKNNTFSDNQAVSGGASLYFSAPGSTTLYNNILANNTGGGECASFGTVFTTAGNNLVEDGSAACPATLTVDPQLGPLVDNGGPTQTKALALTSPAIDAGNDANCTMTDQRGAIRPQGPHCDIGAFEYTLLTISGNTSLGGVTLSYMDGVPLTATSASDGSYSFSIPFGWSGTVTPSLAGFHFTPDHWDYTVVSVNQPNQNYTAYKSFVDVPVTYWAYSFIERLYAAGITSGCGSGSYCPETEVSRGQMAVFLERGMNNSSYNPPAATGTVFGDVLSSYWSASWVEKLFADGITGGCGGGNYCPDLAVSRAQMAVFLLRAKHGSSYIPPPATGVFPDVPTSYWAAPWIEQLYAESITGGCGGGNYCPDQSVTRGQMAVFLVRTFNLP